MFMSSRIAARMLPPEQCVKHRQQVCLRARHDVSVLARLMTDANVADTLCLRKQASLVTFQNVTATPPSLDVQTVHLQEKEMP